jgi:sarcosine oxidase, subunit beta
MMGTVEVAIVGGGIHGVSAGYHLAKQGVRARLFESGGPASGPTGRSSAVCRAFYTNPFLAATARESMEIFRSFREVSGGRASGFRQTGALFLHGPEDGASVRDAAAILAALGTEVELLDENELRRQYPDVDPTGIRVAAWEAGAGYADPVLTTQALLERAVEMGLDARLHCPVTELRSRPGGGAVIVDTRGSQTECARLLISAGPWTRPLARQLGADVPLSVERHYVATFGWNQVRPVPFVLVDVPAGYYMKPEGAELFLAGSLTPEDRADPDHFSASITRDEMARMAACVTARVPRLAAADSRGGWASLYDVSPDWQPVIGEIAEGVFVDAGTSGHGFKLAPALGRHIATLVAGGPVDAGLAQFHPRRFESHAELSAGFGAARIIG